jgi:hypothetical protein
MIINDDGKVCAKDCFAVDRSISTGVGGFMRGGRYPIPT